MPQQFAENFAADISFQTSGRKGVPQRVHMDSRNSQSRADFSDSRLKAPAGNALRRMSYMAFSPTLPAKGHGALLKAGRFRAGCWAPACSEAY